MAIPTLAVALLIARSVAEFHTRPTTPENRNDPARFPRGTPRELVAKTEQKVERMLASIRPALRDFIRGNKPLPIWEAPSDSDSYWISHVNGLRIPKVGAEPNLLHKLGDPERSKYDPSYSVRVNSIFQKGKHTFVLQSCPGSSAYAMWSTSAFS